MTFILSKVLWWFVIPLNIIFALLSGGWLLLFWKPRVGKTLMIIGLLLLVICGLDLFPDLLGSALEERIPQGPISEKIDGIIVLAGMVEMEASREGLVELTDQSDRIVEGMILARKYPHARLILTGSSGFIEQQEDLVEADYLARLAVAMGIKSERMFIERKARNTHEHALELAKMLPKGGRWVLVTSAYHMPRSYGCFRKAGFHVIPYPVDYKTRLEKYKKLSPIWFLPTAANLSRFGVVLHEWFGLFAYRLMGYTDSLFPRAGYLF